MRNAERGTRNSRASFAASDLTLLFRVPTSAFRLCLVLAACTPVTTRPDFLPDPQASRVVLDARPERVTPEIAALVAAESLQVERVNVRDGYVETAWYDTRSHRSFRGTRDVSDLAATVKIRCWADPYVPGQTRLTVEAVYRPRYDPSRTERDLEVIVPKTHAGHAIADSLVAALRKRFGTPSSSPTAP
ncbi:MAG: hypothetical protein AUH78_18915 [Gemmatimonadetes bacterium 13_1_40CM_4_69_8]|nr:MAG: hypothetical protein AUH45_05415 [Gemmatimonadetes bacterium 13_1_40CM_69_22]OLC71173.1 MAG: hypothetical protein AUH78_18915 [Gemmatimonadetes bacterium 13_1_40CM_4_69_8]